ncbi:MAG: TerC family protein [Actinomycetota bacterium]|jgi:predicted tellurium resistance membrane protein TerC|nr:TerC family protein [Actinomycetota bacterium]
MIDLFLQPSSWIAILTLALLEIVLGIDNLVFIAIVTGRLPEEQQPKARRVGLIAALGTRLILLFALSWILGLTRVLAEFHVLGHVVELTGRSLILLGGGLFLMYKATTEIYHKTELKDEEVHASGKTQAFGAVILNIAIMDIIFSLDSVITAVGMVGEIPLMVTAIVIAMGVMVIFADPVSEFVNEHASVKILALSFLLMIGVLLTAEAFEVVVPKGYVYFAMAFSLTVEFVQMRYETNLERRNRGRAKNAPAIQE